MDQRALLQGPGAALLRTVMADARGDLALASHLRGRHDAQLVSLALGQRELRARAGSRLRDVDDLVLTRAGLEQATGTAVARHRATAFAGLGTVVDVCSGIGGDARELVRHVQHVVGVDTDPVHLALANHNAGGQFVPVRADAAALPVRAADAIVVDPARREGDKRRRGHAESSPPLAVCLGFTDVCERVAIKTAPGLERDVVPQDWAIEVVAVGRELKELVLWSPAWHRSPRRATVIRGGVHESVVETFEGIGSRGLLATRPVGEYLLDPSPSITRSGLVQELGAALGAELLDEHIGFLTADVEVQSAFVRSLRVLEAAPWSMKTAKQALRRLEIGDIDIRQRGLALTDIDQVRRKLSRGGGRRGTMVLTRLGESPTMIICEEAERHLDEREVVEPVGQ